MFTACDVLDFRRITCMSLMNRSVITRMCSWPELDLGESQSRSIVMNEKGLVIEAEIIPTATYSGSP